MEYRLWGLLSWNPLEKLDKSFASWKILATNQAFVSKRYQTNSEYNRCLFIAEESNKDEEVKAVLLRCELWTFKELDW